MSKEQQTFIRFSIPERFEHLLLIITFSTLALTGLPQKFPLSPISEWFVRFLGGIEVLRIIHRVCAFIVILEIIYHIVVAAYNLYVRRTKARMIPGVKDALDVTQAVKYNLGFSKEKPRMGRFNFAEKAEYWAMIWGFIVMGITGFMLWNPIFTTKLLPGQIIPAAKAAHGGEAVLAVLAIIVWHFYNVHLKDLNLSMLNGKLTREQMEEEHGQELEEIESGVVDEEVPQEIRKKRERIFYPFAAVFAVILFAVSVFFVTYEDSAIDTIPAVDPGVVAYSPQTPTPLPTIAPTVPSEPLPEGGAAAMAWDNGIGDLFKNTCAACHGTMGGLDLTSYAALVEGGDSGPGIVPGDPKAGSVISVQEKGGHTGQFTGDQLTLIKTWVENGAPEKGGGAASGSLTWSGAVSSILGEKCLSCHGATPEITAGGISFASYDEALQEGVNGPAIVPGDTQASLLVTTMQAGNHPGQLTADELEKMISWIEAGAPAE